MKELAKGEIAGAIGYEAKIEDAKVKISATVDLVKLIDLAAEKVEGGAIEVIVVNLAKSAVSSL